MAKNGRSSGERNSNQTVQRTRFCEADDNKKQLCRKIYLCLWPMDSMLFVMRRQNVCRRERKIIKAHYMLAYECGLRRLRSRPRGPIGIAGVTKSIEARGIYLCIFTIINHPPSFLITIKMFFIFLSYFYYFCQN